jgi:Tol biopolymer transport system component
MTRRVLGLVLAAAVIGAAPAAAGPAGRPIVFSANQFPAVSGEIYRVDLDGRRIDLSRSPFQDTTPAVSPDGRRVAFFSTRGAPDRRFRVFVVGIDGRGLRPVSSFLPSAQAPQLAWSRQGPLAAVALADERPFTMALYLFQPGGQQRLAFRAPIVYGPAWSPDGRVLLVADDGGVRALSPTGTTLWSAASRHYAWSALDLAAISAAGRIGIYDERGRRLASVRGRDFAWSPDGTRLALVDGARFEVRSPSGTLLFAKTVPLLGREPEHRLAWTGPQRVAIGGGQPVGVDLGSGGTWTPTDAAFGVRSPQGALLVTVRDRRGLALRVGDRTLVRVAGCLDDGVATGAENMQFTPNGRSVVYQSWCPEAFDNLYTAGGAVRRLTNVAAQETDPAWSPDGRLVAYSRAEATGLSCKGCPSSLWVANADGSHARQLTHPAFCTFDTGPSWSPDGSSILVARSTCNTRTLVVVDAATGAAQDLHISASQAAWGPERIAYGDDTSIWTAAPDGTDRRKVGRGADPAWSRDGRLAYLDGRTLVVEGRRIRLPFVRVLSLAWSPGGSRLVAAARLPETATTDVYTLRPDGTDIRRVTRDIGAQSASW